MDEYLEKSILQIKTEINYQLAEYNIKDVIVLINIINNVKGTIYFCGVGKCQILAKLI